jgi:hypothetical protein
VLGCPRVECNDCHFSPFSCILQKCPACVDAWKDRVPQMDMECQEKISYVLYQAHSKCSCHSDENMLVVGKETLCGICEELTEEKRNSLKGGRPRVKSVKLRIMLTEKMTDFVKPGGTYKSFLWKTCNHV